MRLCEMDARIDALEIENSALKLQIATLGKDSSTSSKKPSSDDVTKKPKGKKGKDGNKRVIGAQPGHPRHTRLEFSADQIDVEPLYQFSGCPDCGADVADNAGTDCETRRRNQKRL